jgi:hypothetical protein
MPALIVAPFVLLFIKINGTHPWWFNFFFYFQDPKSEVTKLAKFLEVPYTEEFILDIIEKCKIEN